MIVVDASVIVDALGDGGDAGRRAHIALSGAAEIAVPSIYDLEVTSAWRRQVAAGNMSEARAQRAIDDLQRLRVRRVPHALLLGRIWALRNNFTIADAVYIALAEKLNARLLTKDTRMARAPGALCEIEIVS